MTNSAPAGWYADPANPAIENWWDGSAYRGSRPKAPPIAARPAQALAHPNTVYVAVPTPSGYGLAYDPTISPKSRTAASILSFFLGGLGIDRFYLGNIGLGIAKLLLGWLTLGIWPLIDFIVILVGAAHDGRGLAVRNWG